MVQTTDHPHLKQIMQQLADAFGMPGLQEWIHNIEDPLDYADLNERQAVIERNINMLSQKIALLQHLSPSDTQQVKQYVENAGNFEYQEWQELERIKQDLADYEYAVNQQTQEQAVDSMSEAVAKERVKPKKGKRKIASYRGWIPS